MICSNGGRDVPDTSNFCPFCGSNLGSSLSEPLSEPSKNTAMLENSGKKSKKKNTAIILSIIGIVLIAAVIVYLMLPKINYNKAIKAMDEGRWADARALLEKRTYADGANLIEECYMHENADYDFLQALEQSLVQRLDAPDDVDYGDLIDGELALLKEFEKKDFFNKNIGDQAVKYLKGVYKQQSSLSENDEGSYYISDTIGWDEGRLQRYEAVGVLVNEYGLFQDDAERADYCGNYYKTAGAILDIDRDIQAQLIGVNAEYDETSKLYYLSYENRTDYKFDVTFYSSYVLSDHVEYDEVICTDVRPGEIITLDLEVLSNLKEAFDYWALEWGVGKVYKDGELLPE